MKKTRFCFCVLVVSGWSCKDDEPIVPTADEAQMVRELKEYIYFKEGSYWVYQDSATGLIDSQYVFLANEGEGFTPEGEKYYYFNCNVFSTRDSFEYHHWFNSTWTGSDPYRSKVFRIKNKPGDNVGQTALFECPIVPGNRLCTYGNATTQNVVTTEAILDSLQIPFMTVRSVALISQSFDPSEANPGHYYTGKHLGVIRHDISWSYNWKLLCCQLIQ